MLAAEVEMAATYAQRKALGSYGERLAEVELGRFGLQVVDRNWRCAQGEIDLVARDGGALVICEVKTRSSERFGTPLQAITESKAARLRRLGAAWASAHGVGYDELRVDVVSVLLVRGTSPTVTYYPGLA